MIVAVGVLGIREGLRLKAVRPSFDIRATAAALWESKWEVLLPVVALVAIFGGFCTLIEAAAIIVVYALITESIIHRELHPTRDLPRVQAPYHALGPRHRTCAKYSSG